MTWLLNHLATILISVGLAAIVACIVYRLVKARKSGKSSCGAGCAHCAMCGSCHSAAAAKKQPSAAPTDKTDG